LYKSGDLGRRLADGKIEYLKRIDHQVKIRGFRIELGEIEAQLGSHPAVRQCVVVADRNEALDAHLTAYVVYEGKRAPSSVELRNYLKERIPEYMSPARFVRLEEMPLLQSGKVNRQALRASEKKAPEAQDAHMTSLTPVEEIVVGVYKEVLNLDQVGKNEDFFGIGGHSLLATKVILRLRKALDVEIEVKDIFKHATAEGLARLIEGAMRKGKKDQTPPLVRVSREERLPLSFAQQRLWFIDQLVPNNPLYNISRALRFKGKLNLGTFERVVNEIVRRHEVLRTRIEVEDGEPVQVIDEWELRRLEVNDLTALPRERREEEAGRMAREEAGTGFDLSRGPMFRVKVLKLEEEERMVIYTMHHIVSDGWSMGILGREVSALYQAYSAGEASPLADLPVQYADFASWQRQWLQGAVLGSEIEYWRERLQGLEGLELPTDHPRPAAQSYRGSSLHFVVERELTERLRALGRREGVTLFMTLLGGFDVLMARYSGREDVTLGTDIANRNRTEIEGLIGFFVNQLALRVTVKPRETFRELLKHVREVCLGAYAHQDLPFEKLVEELNPERDLSRSPLFQVKFVLQDGPRERGGADLEGIGVRGQGGEMRPVNFDLTVGVMDVGEALVGFMDYSLDLFEAGTIERLISHYTNVLKGVVEDSENLISQVDLLSLQEREQIVVEWNRTERTYPNYRRIHELFERQVERAPEAVAVIDGNRRLTYDELNARANQLARHLRQMGVGPETLVGVCLERSLEMVVALLGVLKAGAAYLPLDPIYPAERIAYMLEDAQVKALLTEERLLGTLPVSGPLIVALDADWALIANESAENLPESATPGNLAYAIYTSGSTGRPKGVLVPHRQAVNFFTAMDVEVEPDPAGVWLAVTSISFDISVLELLWTLARGFQVVAHREGEVVSMAREIIKRQVTHLQCTPSMAKMISMEEEWIDAFGSLRKLIIGGEVFPQDLAEKLRVVVKGEIRNMYGPTETTVWSATHALKGDEKSIPIGRPVANTRIYILDQGQEIAPIGVIGELYIGGDGVVRGYLNQAEATGDRFMPDAFSQTGGARVYRSGDLARYRDDGLIEILGRVDYQVKIRGYRIELGEIENVLGAHAGVRECVVAASEDDSGEKRLVAYVVKDGEREPSEGELRSYLKERLPEYMAPAWFVRLEEMPLTPNGKVDRRALPSPNMKRAEEVDGYLTPRTAVEEIVTGIFEEALKLDRVGRRDNFFDLGGHSLLATQVVSRVRKMSGVEIGVRSVFEKPTAEGLASRIEEALRAGKKDEAPPLVRVSREQRLPLSFAQQRLWFLDQLEPGSDLYNMPGAIRLEGGLDLDALERSVNEIVRRHEVLRTRIVVESGEPAQVIDVWEPRRLEVVDLSSLSQEEKEAEVRRRRKEEAETGFDLSRGPLLRVKALKLEDDDYLLLYAMHHIVSDGWSMEILIREVERLYQAYSAEEESPLAELEIQYADFAVWQRSWLQGSTLQRELEYWRNQLHGLEDIKLPTDHPRPAARSYRGENRQFVIESELADGLRTLSRREGVTLFMTLLGAFDVLMSRYSGGRDVTLGTDIANRNREEIEGLIGFFVNQLALRVDVRIEEGFSSLLKKVRETCLGAYAHQDLPFEKLVEELRPERDLSRAPLFQVKLIMRNEPNWRPALGGGRLRNGNSVATEALFEGHKAKLDLTMVISDEGHDLSVEVEYSRDLFEAGTIDRLMNHYGNALKGIVDDSERAISDLSLLSEEERAQIVVEWNETGKSYSPDLWVHEIFEERAERSPERVALIGAGQALSYGELNRRANQLGNYLQGLGVGPEAVVGLCMERSVEMVAALLGTLKAGGAYLPLDPDYPLERLSFMLEDAGVEVVLTDRKMEGRLPAFWGQTVCLDVEWESISRRSDVKPASEVDAGNVGYVIYTSGSTGKPKGVMVAHQGLCNLVEAQKEIFGIGEDARVLQFASLSFDASVWEIFGALAAGRSLHLYGRESLMPGADLLRALKEDQITTVTLPPSVLAALGTVELKDLETIVAAGEACSAEIVEMWAGGRRFLNAYGPTEATVCASVGECKAGGNGSPGIGRPIKNTKLYILDGRVNPTPVGTQGELYIAGAGLARGYLGRPDLTAERFMPNLFSAEAGGRLYRTGDVVRYLTDGQIEFIGRADEQVKVRGRRIELGEIEAALNQLDTVKRSVVLASEDENGARRLIAYVAAEETAAGLKKRLRKKLPEHMVPEVIMILEEMPLTANGKIDRKRLPSFLKDVIRQPEQDYAGARTPIEEMVVGIFEEVLNMDRVGIQDNFFEMGGHSLLATQVISRIQNAFGVEINVRSIFEGSTAGSLARNIEEAMRSGEKTQAPPLAPVGRGGQKGNMFPLSFPQRRLWFIDRLNPDNPVYNLPGAMRLEGVLDLEALDRVVNEIFRRHEVLRTRIEMEAGEPAQVIEAWEPRRLEVIDLRGWSRGEKEEEITRRLREEARVGFNLSRGPLLRVKVLKLDETEHVVIYTMHHIVSDGWSSGILIKEVEALYQAYSAGEESPLGELEIQYADYAVWQRNWLQGEALDRQLSYWKRQLNGAPATLELPIDRRRPSIQNYRGGKHSLTLPAELTAGLKDLSRRQDVTLFMTLLAAFNALLHRYSWQEDIIVGTVVANRNRQETERLIGFFVNLLALRTNLSGNPTFTELLARVREVALEAYAHQDMPFDLLVEELQPARDPRRTPLFQVLFVLQNAPEPIVETRPALEAQEMRLTPLEIDSDVTRYDLTLSMTETRHGLRGFLEYDTDLFEAATIMTMLKNYAALLEAMVAYPERRVLDAPLNLNDENNPARASNLSDKPIENALEDENFLF
jgi:amino acid adenylation domain-containing protein